MRKIIIGLIAVVGVAFMFGVASGTGRAQRAAGRPTITQSDTPPAFPLSRVEDMLIEFPLPKGEEKYASIDGKKMHEYVVEQAAISKRYRDAGHPKYWGRIIGTSSDSEHAEWLLAKMKAVGLTDVHSQPFDLVPQWTPTNWDVKMTLGGKTITLDSAQPGLRGERASVRWYRAGCGIRHAALGTEGGLHGPERERESGIHLQHAGIE